MNVIKLRVNDLINNNLQKLMTEIEHEENNLLNKDELDDNKINLKKIKEEDNNLFNNDENTQIEKKNDNNKMILEEIKEKNNNLLNKGQIEKKIESFNIIDNNKINSDNFFQNKIHFPLEESDRIDFYSKYFIQNLSINELKNSFIKENSQRFYNDSGNLLLSSKLFQTTKDKFKKVELKMSNNIDNNYHFLKDKNILVTQYYENAAAFDLGYLYGESNKKIFIEFQMKSYKDYFEHNRTFSFSKEKILKKTALLLFNSKLLLDVDIIELNYVIVGLYFKDEINFKDGVTYTEDLIKFCTKNKFRLILYDPFTKKFFDSNKNYTNEIKINDKYINLLKDEELQPFQVEQNKFLQKKTNRQLEDELVELTNKANNLAFNKKLTLHQLMNFVEEIKSDLNLKKLRYAGSCKFMNSLIFPFPKGEYIFLFYKKEYEKMIGLNKFYAFLQDNNEFYVYDFETKNYLHYDYNFLYFHLFNTNEKYYIFKIEKISRITNYKTIKI